MCPKVSEKPKRSYFLGLAILRIFFTLINGSWFFTLYHLGLKSFHWNTNFWMGQGKLYIEARAILALISMCEPSAGHHSHNSVTILLATLGKAYFRMLGR